MEPVSEYPEKTRPVGVLVISGACSTPSQLFPEAVIVNPFIGIDSDAPLEVRLSILIDPVCKNVTPELVAPLR